MPTAQRMSSVVKPCCSGNGLFLTYSRRAPAFFVFVRETDTRRVLKSRSRFRSHLTTGATAINHGGSVCASASASSSRKPAPAPGRASPPTGRMTRPAEYPASLRSDTDICIPWFEWSWFLPPFPFDGDSIVRNFNDAAAVRSNFSDGFTCLTRPLLVPQMGLERSSRCTAVPDPHVARWTPHPASHHADEACCAASAERERLAGIDAAALRSISRSSRAASSGLTSVIGSRTSALSISPLRHSQYLIGAGLGSANNSRVSPRPRPARLRGLALARASRFRIRAKVSVSICADARMPPSAPSASAS